MREYRANATSELTQLELENGRRVREMSRECMVLLESAGFTVVTKK